MLLKINLWRLGATALALLLLTACGRRMTTIETGARDRVLYIGNSSEPRDLDPTIAVSVTESHIFVAIYEGLVSYSPDAKKIVPGAAESWDISPDGKVYTFHLRAGLKWSNGEPLTAQDFLYAFQRLAEPALGAEQAIYLDPIVGGNDYREGRTHDLNTLGVRAPDDRTLEIRLINRAPYFLGMLAINPFYPLYRPAIEKSGARLRRDGLWTRPGALVGNGPFRLTDWRVNASLTVAKNPNYWNAGQVWLNQVVFLPIDNVDSEERAFRGGTLAVTRNVPAIKLDTYRREKSPDLRVDELINSKYITFNCSRPPFNDVRVRRAFALAVDRKTLVDDVVRDGSRLADSLSVPGSGVGASGDGYRSRTSLVFDPNQARALLAAAGFPGGAGFPTVSATLSSGHQGDQKTVEALQAMWQKELGIHIDLVVQEEKVWLDTLRTRNFQLLMDGWTSGVNDPVDMFQLFLGSSPNNDASWVDPAYDGEYAAAAAAPDDTAREVHLQTMDAILIEQLPMIPLYHTNQSYLVHPSVHGMIENMLDWHPFNNLTLEMPGAPAK